MAELNDPLRSSSIDTPSYGNSSYVYGQEPSQSKQSKQSNTVSEFINRHSNEAKETVNDYGARICSTYLVATVIGFNPLAAVAYSTAVFIIGKIAEKTFVWHSPYFNDKIHNRLFWTSVTVATGALFLRYGLVPQYALTLIGIERLASFVKFFGVNLKNELQNGSNSGRCHMKSWKEFLLSGSIKLIVAASLSYGIATLTGMNPVAAAIYCLATHVFYKIANLILIKLKHPDSVDASQTPIVYGFSACIIHLAYGITRIHSLAYFGIYAAANKVAEFVVDGRESL